MSNIPSARSELREIASALRATGSIDVAERIEAVVTNKLIRRPLVKNRTRARNRAFTPEVAEAIRTFVRSPAGRDMSYADVGTRFGVNSGRVSEAMHEDL